MRLLLHSFFLVAGLLFGAAGFSRPSTIIPAPAEYQEGKGFFHLQKSTSVAIAADAVVSSPAISDYLAELRRETGLPLPIQAKGQIVFNLVPTLFSPHRAEAYAISIEAGRVLVEATDAAGMFYALQSLRQLLEGKTFPALHIRDYPQYAYRGMHLDVSRHFFAVDFIRRYIDLLARYKLNTFHWHLTDSHGWRLESKRYPRLTSIGAWRAPREGIPMTIAQPTQPGENATYGGFYTQEEVKAIVAYAKARFIEVIPEIEMPGHSTAALVAYPQFSTRNGAVPLRIPGGYAGDLMHNFCVGNDSTFLFLNDVLDEVMTLFPSRFIHIGGDEVRGDPWLRCDRCQQRMKEKGFTNTRQLQAYFTARIDSFVTARGRRTIGWDEILEAGHLSKTAAVMSWRGTEGGIDGARKGHPVVMAPYRYVYFDFYQSAPELEPDITYAGLTLDSVYAFQPRPAVLDSAQAANIIGAQACLWTENVPTAARAEYMLLPRMLAFAEAVWTPPARKDYAAFVRRTENAFTYFRQQGIQYASSLYNPGFVARYDSAARAVELRLTTQTAGWYTLRYTFGEMPPTGTATAYTGPLQIRKSTSVTAGLFDKKGHLLGKPYTQYYSLHLGFGRPVRPLQHDTLAQQPLTGLTDGIFGSIEPYDGKWVFSEDSVWRLRIDLGKSQALDSIRFRCLEDSVGNTFLPGRISLLTSADGKVFNEAYEWRNPRVPAQQLRHIRRFMIPLLHKEARYIELVLERSTSLPPSKTAPLLFTDEIEAF